MGKKESTDRRLNQACRLSVTPSSLSSLECRRSDARTATNGYVRTCSLNKSAKVVLGPYAFAQKSRSSCVRLFRAAVPSHLCRDGAWRPTCRRLNRLRVEPRLHAEPCQAAGHP